MLTQQRKDYILDILKRDGRIVAKNVAQELALSEDTIRRDLRDLAKSGLLQRVHGGALPASAATADLSQRQDISTDEKIAIGKTAAAMVQPGQVVILDGGTTTTWLARHLPQSLNATIVTHSPAIAMELLNHPHIEVILIGGKFFKHSAVTVGAAALEALSHIRADTFFMGATGIHPEVGITTGDVEEAYMKKMLSQHSGETILLASKEKIGVASAYVIMPANDINAMVVNRATPEDTLQHYRGLNIELTESQF